MRALLITMLSLMASAPVVAKEIVLGQIVNLRGDVADSCRDFNAGAQTYLDMINAKGGIAGDRVVLRSRQESADGSDALSLSRELVEREGAVALFGFCGGSAAKRVVSSAWFSSADVPMLAPFSGSDALRGSKVGPVFHVRAGNSEEAVKLVKTLKGFGLSRVALVASRDEEGRDGGAAYINALSQFGVKPAVQLNLQPNGDNVASIVKQIEASGTQAVLVAASTVATASLVGELKVKRPGTMIFAFSEVNHITLGDYLGSSAAAQGVMIATLMPSPYFAVTPIAREHIKAMRQFRDEPPSQATLEGYVAARVAVEAIRRAPRKNAASDVLQALSHLGTLDLGGYKLNVSRGQSGSNFVDVAVVANNGKLLN
ncbi:ABC transporter substrate-binding protein [Burkholderiaceae bacterium DAT-1]|nr:ABC transporter substrate-binding protein [Burkholderiaceae bacterium DAT-1]